MSQYMQRIVSTLSSLTALWPCLWDAYLPIKGLHIHDHWPRPEGLAQRNLQEGIETPAMIGLAPIGQLQEVLEVRMTKLLNCHD